MAYKQNPARGQSDSFDSLSFIKWRNGEGDPPTPTKTTTTTLEDGSTRTHTVSRDDQGLLTQVIEKRKKSSGASSEGKLASKEKWNQFLNSPKGKAWQEKQYERKELKQVPIKPAVKIESGSNIRDVEGVTPVKLKETESKQKKSSSKSRRKRKPRFKPKKQKLFSTKMKTSCKKGKC